VLTTPGLQEAEEVSAEVTILKNLGGCTTYAELNKNNLAQSLLM